MIDRAIQSLLQRTRPPSTPPHYDRAPAGRAPAGGGGGGGVTIFPARIVAPAAGAGNYTVREQVISAEGGFSDKPGAANLTATNLAELSLGAGAAVDDDTIVLVLTVADTGSPPTLRYVFDHPAYAKYLD